MFNSNLDLEAVKKDILLLSQYVEEGLQNGQCVLESLGNFYSNNAQYDHALIAYQQSLSKIPDSLSAKAMFERLSEWEQIVKKSPLFGRKWVITGDLAGMDRQVALGLIESFGGLTSNAPVNDMDYLVVGYLEWSEYNSGTPTRKILKAEELQKKGRDIKIISDKDFFNILIGVAKPLLSNKDFEEYFGSIFAIQ